jgi:predicted aspartyl protease
MRYLLALFGFSALFSSAVQAQVKVPFILQENKCVFVEVKVNDHPTPLLFFFDTGAGSIMLSQEVAEQLNIKPTYTETISGASGEKVFQIAEGQTLILGDKIVLDNVDFIFDDTSRLAKSFGRKFDGIVGYDFLHKYMTKVDFDHKEFWVYESPEQLDTKGFTKHAITMSEDIPIPHFDVTFRLKDESAYTGQVLFDSGAGLNLLINSKFQQQHNLLDKMPNRLTASQNDLTSGGLITISPIQSLSFFDYEFDKPMIAHISTDKSGVSAMPGYLGILGAEIINRFNFIIDYEKNLLYLEPNSLFDMTMDTTVFPFRLVLENGKILVNHLIENTDAAKQGIKAGDEILEVNNQPVKDLVWTKEQIKATKGAVDLKIRKSDGAVENKTFRLTTL